VVEETAKVAAVRVRVEGEMEEVAVRLAVAVARGTQDQRTAIRTR